MPLTPASVRSAKRTKADDKVAAYDALGLRLQQGLESIGRSLLTYESQPSSEVSQLRDIATSAHQLLLDGHQQNTQVLQTQQMIAEQGKQILHTQQMMIELLSRFCQRDNNGAM